MYQVAFPLEFPIQVGADYAAFIQNVMMSMLFINMLISRRGTRGQNSTVAISKRVGTLAAIILHLTDRLLLFLGLICWVLDIIYIGLVVWIERHADILRDASKEDMLVEFMGPECPGGISINTARVQSD